MGYCVDIEIRDVKIPVIKTGELISIFQKFDSKKRHLVDKGFTKNNLSVCQLFSELRYNCKEIDNYYCIDHFWGEKLGGDEIFWKMLAPVLDDCEIVFYGEDGTDWKIVIKNHKVKKIYRQEF